MFCSLVSVVAFAEVVGADAAVRSIRYSAGQYWFE